MANLTPKQEKFAQKYVETGNASEAHRCAGYGPNMNPKTRNEHASRLLSNSKIKARIAELQVEHAEKHAVTVESLIDELEEARTIAAQAGSASSMVAATMGKAKLLGFDGPKQETAHDDMAASISKLIDKLPQ